LAQAFDIPFDEAAGLVGAGEVVQPPAGSGIDPGSLDLSDDTVRERLEQILETFTEAEQALPDFARYQELQERALRDLEQLLAEVEAGDVGAVDEDIDAPAAA